ncbi:MAG: hypothetical protein WBC90_05465, partial [Albidovulum sp.]
SEWRVLRHHCARECNGRDGHTNKHSFHLNTPYGFRGNSLAVLKLLTIPDFCMLHLKKRTGLPWA